MIAHLKGKLFVFLFSFFVFAIFVSVGASRVHAAPIANGIGWAMPVAKADQAVCFPDNANQMMVRVVVTSSTNFASRPLASLKMQNVANSGSSITSSTMNDGGVGNGHEYLELGCLDTAQGVWVSAWGASGFTPWDSAVNFNGNSQAYNFCCGFSSTDPVGDKHKFITYYVFLQPSAGTSILASVPANASTITMPAASTTQNVAFTVQNVLKLAVNGAAGSQTGTNVQDAFIWLHATSGQTLPTAGPFGSASCVDSQTCFYHFGCFGSGLANPGSCYSSNGTTWTFGTNLNLTINSLPLGGYQWYSQMMENPRTYCPFACLAGTIPITGQSAWQTFTVVKTPTVDIKANGSDGPITIANNTAATITWPTISNATSCSNTANMPAGNWLTATANSTGAATGLLTISTTYTLTCTNAGITASDSVTVNIDLPPVAPTGLTITSPLPCANRITVPDNYIGGSDAPRMVTFGWAAVTGATSYEVRVTGPTATFLDDPSGGWAFATVPVGTLSVDSSPNPPPPNPGSLNPAPPKWGSSPVIGSTNKSAVKLLIENNLVGASNTTGTPVNGWTGSQYGEVHFRITTSAGATYNWEVIARNSAGGTASVKVPFTVLQCSTPTPPVSPVATIPDGCLKAFNFTPILNWNNAGVGYVIEVSLSNAVSALDGSYTGVKTTLTVASGAPPTTGAETGWTPGVGLVNGPSLRITDAHYSSTLNYVVSDPFYWHVKNTNGALSSAWTTGTPTTFPFCSPTNPWVEAPQCSYDPYGTSSTSTAGVVDPTRITVDPVIGAQNSNMVRFSWNNLSNVSFPTMLAVYDISYAGGILNGELNYADSTPTLASKDGSGLDWNSYSDGGTSLVSGLNFFPLTPGHRYIYSVQYIQVISLGAPFAQFTFGNASAGTFSVPLCPHHDLHVDTSGVTISPSSMNATGFPLAGSAGCTTVQSTFTLQAGNKMCIKVRIVNKSPTSGIESQGAPSNVPIGVWPAGAPVPPGLFACSLSGLSTPKYTSSLSTLPPLPTTQGLPAGSGFQTTLGLGVIDSGPLGDSLIGSVVSATPRGELGPGESAIVTIDNITIPNYTGAFTATIIADPGCTNDGELVGGGTWGDNTQSPSYTVAVPGFFDTTFGDVGAKSGNVGVSTSTTKSVSDYLVTSSGLLQNTSSRAGWTATGYTKPIVPTGTSVYDYVNSKIRPLATAASASCPDAITGSFVSGYYICPGITINGITPSHAAYPTLPTVVFVDGNLNIETDYSLQQPANASTTKSVIYIVSGDVVVSSGVSRVEGVFIVKGAFKSSQGIGPVASKPGLTVYGAVYAGTFDLKRTSGNPATGVNTADTIPGEQFNFYTKYLMQFNTLLGSNSTVWQEVTP